MDDGRRRARRRKRNSAFLFRKRVKKKWKKECLREKIDVGAGEVGGG